VPTLLAYGDHIYSVNDKGIAACNLARTGAAIWSGQRLGNTDFSASPVLIDGKVYAVCGGWEGLRLRGGARFNLLATNTIGEPVFATPAVADGRLFIRGSEHLFLYRQEDDAVSMVNENDVWFGIPHRRNA